MNLSPAKDLLVRDWKENVINLIQFPRAACIPSPSPFSLKLETFIKIANLPYKNVDNNFKSGSSKGQIPFIELNGRQHADSGNIIQFLIKEFHLTLDSELNTKQLADYQAYTILLEESFFRALAYMRAQDLSWMFNAEKGFLGNMTGVKKFLAGNFGAMFSKSKLQKTLQIQGMGRNSVPEVIEIMKRDLVALDTLLDGKKYFFGNHPTSFDATAFGQLAQLFYTPQPVDDVVTFAETTTPNIKAFVERIKAEYWPEWEEITTNLLMNAKSADEKAAEAVASVSPVVTEELAPTSSEIKQ